MKIEISSRSGDPVLAGADAARRSMARLMAVAGHDLKQPLQVAVLSIARALRDDAGQSVRGRLSVALDALQRMNTELDAIARLSQRDAAPLPEPRIVLLDEVLARVQNDWRAYADICGTKLRVAVPRVFVATDPEMLATILRNFIGNAIKFSGPRGSVSVTGRVLDGRIAIDVHDTGCGIDPVAMPKIFDAFTRGRGAAQTEGLGLGLLIVRETAALLGYPIAVRSVEDVGSTFTVEVPTVGAHCPNAVAFDAVRPEPGSITQ